MKNSIITVLSLLSLTSCSQAQKLESDSSEWASHYTLPVPKDWTVERFPIPIAFAPQIPYKGVEDIRFMPGWGNAKSNEYWTYAFLWYLDGIQKTDSKIVEENLKAYYTGLNEINAATQVTPPIKVKAKIKKVKTDKGDSKTFRGTIYMFDYIARKPISLYCIIHLKYCAKQNNTIVFYEISPKPFDDNIWYSLNQLWIDFRFDNCSVK